MTLILILLITIFIFLCFEIISINNKIKQINYIIHVNGTRGKSSVTKYISSILRSNNKRTLAKITGRKPTIIFPNGNKKIIRRLGTARVQEQVKLIRLCSKLSINYLVVECMSIRDELQKLENKLFKPQIYVITNIRDDHQEHFQGGIDDYGDVICSAIPKNATVVTSEKKYISRIKNVASKKNSKVVEVNTEHLQNIPDGIFNSNIAIALEVARIVGVEQKLASKKINQILKKEKSPIYKYKVNGNLVELINGFSVNDVESANDFLNYWEMKLDGFNDKIIIFNTRSDRPIRTKKFCQWISKFTNVYKIIITGSHSYYAKRCFIKEGVEAKKILIWNAINKLEIKKKINKLFRCKITVIGLGNEAGGVEENMWNYLKNMN